MSGSATFSSPPTVFIVDDDPGMLDSVRLLLESAALSTECHSSARSFLETYRTHRPGCLILDVRMPEMSGLELQELLAVRSVNIPIIFITGHGDVPMSVKAMTVSYTHLRAHETDSYLVCRLLLEKKK